MSHPGTSWMDDAACLKGKHKTRVFFPEKKAGVVTDAYKKALAKALHICARCPVREQCGEYAITNGLEVGVFGMMTADQRIQERKRRQLNQPRQQPRCGTDAGYRQHARLGEPKCEECEAAHRAANNATAAKRRQRRRSTAA